MYRIITNKHINITLSKVAETKILSHVSMNFDKLQLRVWFIQY